MELTNTDMPSRIPVSAAAELGKKFGLQTVVLHCWDGTLQHIVSWGHTAVHCDYAAQAATIMETAFKWEGVEERLPSRVRTLKKDKEELWVRVNAAEAEVARLAAGNAELNERLATRTADLLAQLSNEKRLRQLAGFSLPGFSLPEDCPPGLEAPSSAP